MNTRKGFKGFTLVELVIVLGVVAILSAVLVPTFVGILNNSKVSAKYERASSARTDYFLENDEFDALADMRTYLILVDDNVLYEVDRNGEIILSDSDFDPMDEDNDYINDYIEVQRAYDTDDSVKIYQPREQDAYGRAIKARNDYRRKHDIDRSYFEMDNYIIRVSNDEEGQPDRFFKVVYEGQESSNNGALIEIDEDIESLLANGFDYYCASEYEDIELGIVYKPTVLTQLTYRIGNIEEDMLLISHADENMKEGDFVYVIDGEVYRVDENGIVHQLVATKKAKSGIQMIDSEVVFDDSELIANGYQRVQTDTISDEMRGKLTEGSRELATYAPIACYAICYGYYDTTDTYVTWTEFRSIYGEDGEVTSIVYKPGLSVAGIKRLIVSNTVISLGYGAFADYEDMEAIVLPETITDIALNPLTNPRTTEIRIHSGNGVYEDYGHTAIVKTEENLLIAGTIGLLNEESVLPDSITSIEDYAFESTTLTTINVMGLEMGKGIFKNCVSLVNVTHDLDTEIADEMFSGCVTLEYFTMPNVVEVIGRDAFKNCVSIIELDLPVTLAEIKVGAFDNDTMTLYYADSKKTFNDTVTVGANLSTVRMEYAIKDIVYVLGAGSVAPETPNPLKLDPTSEEELTLYSPYINYKYRFVDWSVKGTETNNPYPNIVAGEDLENPYKLVQNTYNEDITLTANYDLIVYNINYRINGTSRTDDLVNHNDVEFTYEGEFLGEYNTTLSSTITMPQLDKVGYTFDGWSLNGSKLADNGSTFTQYGRRGDVTLTAVFNVIIYTITYDYVNGTVGVANATTYTIESPVFTLSNPTKQDYEFIGWTGSNGEDPQMTVTVGPKAVGDKEFVANYTPITYTLTYNPNGGTVAGNPSTFNVETEDYELNSPTKRGYTFKGWNDGTKNIGTTFVCSTYHENTRLTAFYTANVYNIEYEGAHVDSYNNPTTYTYDTTTSLRNPTMSVGYRFVNWTEEHDWVDSGYLISDDTHAIGDITIRANSEVIVYTISCTLNGGGPDGMNPTEYNIESADITLVNPTRTGYDFRGWTGSNGNSAAKSVTIHTGSTGNKTYTANWDLITYTISYTLNSGIVTGNPTEYTYESSDIVISNPTRTGYTFGGWTGTGLNVKTTTVTIPNHSTGNKTFTANWNVINYTLTYVLNGGSASNPATYNIETATFSLNNPTKTAYEFTGWTGTDISGKSTDVVISRGSIGNRSFTATYTPVIYTITYNLNGGAVATTNPTQYNVETTTFTLNNPTRAGYTFDGWTGTDLAETTTTVKVTKGSMGNRSYVANWTVITYAISYTLNSGTVSPANPTTYTVETATFTLTNPTRRGYTFNGWTGTNITGKSTAVTIAKGNLGDRSYTATFTKNTYTIGYTLNGGTIDGTNPSTFDVETPTFTLINPTRRGYTFNGWSGTGIAGTTNTVTIEIGSIDNRTYTANFTVITYTLTYTLNGGTADNPSTYTVDSNQITLANPTKNGYNFTGWTGTDVDGESEGVVIPHGSIGNRSYAAHYTVIVYTISYQLNNGSVGTSNPTTYTIETESFTLNNPTRTGYTFNGWTGSNGTTKQTSVSVVKGSTGNKSYTANYTVITYTISYTLNGGSATNPANYNVETETFTLNNPTKNGYTFDGWTGTNGETKQKTITINVGSTGDRTYTANFSPTPYTITYNHNGGTSSNNTSYTIETATFSLSNATRTGYNFTGWTGQNDVSTGLSGYTQSSPYTAAGRDHSIGSEFTVYSGAVYRVYCIAKRTAGSLALRGGIWYTGRISGNAYDGLANYTLAEDLSDGWARYYRDVTVPGGKTKGKFYIQMEQGLNGAECTTTYQVADMHVTLLRTIATTLSYTQSSPYNASGRDHAIGNEFSVTAGQTYRVYVVAKRTAGELDLKGGIWYTAQTEGASYDGYTTYTLEATLTSDSTWGVYYRDVTVPTGKTKGKIFIQMEQSSSTGFSTVWAIGGGHVISPVTPSVSITKGSTGNRTYNANWNRISYTITYNLNGGSVSTANPASYTIQTASFTLNNPTRTGYTFSGWSGAASGTSVTVNKGSTGNKTFNANWTANPYTVTLNQQSGSGGTGSVTATYGSAMPSATKPSRTGYTFGGYYTSTGGGGTQYYNGSMGSVRNWDKTANTTLYAKWTANTYTVTLDRQSGSGGTGSVTATYASGMPSASAPGRTGYTFGGYYTSTGGGGTQYYNASMGSCRNWDKTSNTTLYAKWTANKYNIHFDKWNGWNGTTDITATYGQTLPSISCPTKDYYGFAGYWTSSFGNGDQCYNSGGGGTRGFWWTNNITVYAKWNRGGSQSGWYTSSASRNNGYPDRHVLEWWETGWDCNGNSIHARAYLTGGSTSGRYQSCGYRRIDIDGTCVYYAEWAHTLKNCKNGYEIMAGDKWIGHYCTAYGMSISSKSSHYYSTSWNSSGSGWWAITNW